MCDTSCVAIVDSGHAAAVEVEVRPDSSSLFQSRIDEDESPGPQAFVPCLVGEGMLRPGIGSMSVRLIELMFGIG